MIQWQLHATAQKMAAQSIQGIGFAIFVSAVVSLLLLPIPLSSIPTSCKTNSVCNCQQSNEDTILTCRENDHPDTKLLYKPRKGYLEIKCDHRCSKCYIDNLHDLGFNHTSSVDIKNCPLPKTNFSLYTNGYNISRLWFKAADEHPLVTIGAAIFRGMSALTQLSLQECGLMEVPHDLLSFTTNLHSVSLRGNKLTMLPKNFLQAVPKLKVFDLGYNQLRSLSDSLGSLPSLEHLYLFNNHLRSITRTAFDSSNNITLLELQGNHLETLPEDVFDNLPLLETISLYSNLLGSLPPNLFNNNSQLKQVLLQDNVLLNEIPEQLVANHTKLEELNLSMCNFSSLPELAFQALHNLVQLDLSYNKLTTLPEKLLKDCASLELLELSHNSLTKLPVNTFRGSTRVAKLLLNHNKLTSLPADILTHLTSAVMIDISHNHLFELDDQFFALDQLITLSVAHNKISYIGSNAFINCLSLQKILLNNNRLNDTIFQLPMNTTYVDLSYNLLNQMPTDWEWLPHIRILNLSHNVIEFVDTSNLQYSTEVSIDLQHNQLQTINMAGEHEADIKPVARVGFNPLNCDCSLEALLQHMVNQNQDRDIMIRLDIEDLQCQRPAYLAGKEVAELEKGELVCNITTPRFCPKQCYCQFREIDRVTEVLCRNKALSRVPNLAPGNTSALDLTGNHLLTLAGLDEPRWHNLTALILTGNNLSSLEVGLLPSNLRALYIDHNFLKTLSEESMGYLTEHPQIKVRLGHNPWVCNCNDQSLQHWLDMSQNILDRPNMTCDNLVNTTVSRFQCHEAGRDLSHLMIGLVAISVLVSIIVALTGIAYYKYQHVIRIWLFSRGWCLFIVKEKDIDADKQFDAFVSFSQEDVEWVGHVLLPGLEDHEPFYRLCIHQRNWPAGEWIPDQIERSVEASCRTIVVLSPNFLRSVWTRLEFKAAYYKALKDRMNRVIIVVLGDVPPKEEMEPDMRRYVDLNTYVQYEDPWFWKKLRYAMPHNPVSSNSNNSIPNQWFITPTKSTYLSSSSTHSSQSTELTSLSNSQFCSVPSEPVSPSKDST